MTLKFSSHDLFIFFKCKYLKMIMNDQFIWKHHLKHLKKKSFVKFNIFTILTKFIWKINIEDLRRIYFVIVLSQFIFCVSMWFVFNENHDYKQKKNATFIFMKNVQIRATKIIFETFWNTIETILNVELHLLSMQNQMNVVLYDVMLRIIISLTYSFIKIQRIQFNRQLMTSQI